MDWNISKGADRCLVCGKVFQEEEDFFSSLYADRYNLLRKDYCVTCWTNNQDHTFFSFWKTRMPTKEEPKKRQVDEGAILDLFLRLGEEPDPWARNLRYVLALFLLRKKHLKLKEQGTDEQGEFLILYYPEEDKLFHIYNPHLGEDEVARLNDEILKLFDPNSPGQTPLLAPKEA